MSCDVAFSTQRSGRASQDAESYLTVHRTPRWEKTPQIAANRGPQ
jgi:hypothetical protein